MPNIRIANKKLLVYKPCRDGNYSPIGMNNLLMIIDDRRIKTLNGLMNRINNTYRGIKDFRVYDYKDDTLLYKVTGGVLNA